MSVSAGSAESHVDELEKQLYANRDATKRKRLLRLLIKELESISTNVEFATTLDRHIAKTNERIRRQKELVAGLKREGRDTKQAYFLLITMKTMAALFAHHRSLARKVLVIVVPTKD